jgi:hypothetical protein
MGVNVHVWQSYVCIYVCMCVCARARVCVWGEMCSSSQRSVEGVQYDVRFVQHACICCMQSIQFVCEM